MASYQEALSKAGYSLTAVGDMLGLLTTVLTVVCGVLTVAAVISGGTLAAVAAPVLAKVIPITTKLGIASALITAAGNSLISSAEKGIVDDANLMGNLAKDVTIEGAKIYIAQKILPVVGGKISKVVAKKLSTSFGKSAGNVFSKAWNPRNTMAKGLSKKFDFKVLYKNSVPKADPKLYKNLSYLQRYSKHVDSKIFEGVIIDSIWRVGSLITKKPIPKSGADAMGQTTKSVLSGYQSKPSAKKTGNNGGAITEDEAPAAPEISTPNSLRNYKPRTAPGLNS